MSYYEVKDIDKNLLILVRTAPAGQHQDASDEEGRTVGDGGEQLVIGEGEEGENADANGADDGDKPAD